MTNKSELIQLALEARKKTYSPYSNYAVGAALLTRSGKIYTAAVHRGFSSKLRISSYLSP